MNTLLVISLLGVALVHSIPVKRSFKVYHGDRLTSWSENKFKFVAALFGDSLCSATIYSTKHLISAGHCFVGEEDLPDEALFAAVNVYDQTLKRIPIKQTYLRNDYVSNYEKSQVNGKDISVVELVSNIPTTRYEVSVATVELMSTPDVGSVLTIVGYGMDTYRDLEAGHFNQGQLEVVQCPRGHQEEETRPICMSPSDAFKRKQNEGGDSGGPALLRNKSVTDDEWSVVGVSSGFTTYADDSVVAVYASTARNCLHIEMNTLH